MDPKLKRKKDLEEKERLHEAYEEFRETFEEGGGAVKIAKTFIRGDVVNANKSVSSTPAVYKPTPIQLRATTPILPKQPLDVAKRIAEETAKKIMQEAGTRKAPVFALPPTAALAVPPTTTASAAASGSKPPKPGTKKVVEQKSRLSNLEAFKEELKQMQAMRDERKGLRQQLKEKLGVPETELDKIAPELNTPYGGVGGGNDYYGEDDPNTTNLYVCNLPADTKLEDFFETFGTFGPLASAKILYPRADDEQRRYRDTLSGFVAFMSRTDAERAKCAMHGETIRGCELRVSWARPVPMPPLPFHVPVPLRELAMPDPPSGLPFNARPRSEELREFLQRYNDLPKLGTPLDALPPQMVADYKKMVGNGTVRVVVPTERQLLVLIHRVVEFLVRCGPLFEAILMARERQNQIYRFLFDNHHPTHVYYRWRLYTVLQGDDRQKWRMEKFKMFEGGSWWQPPPHSLFEEGMPPQLYDIAYVPKRRRDKPYEKRVALPPRRTRRVSGASSDEEERSAAQAERRRGRSPEREEEKQRKWKGVLRESEREELEELLRGLTPEKVAVGDTMVWCLEHAECAKEITQCIFESLCIKETPLHKKIARIYLVSDILANCAARVKDAFYYRQHFGECLLKIFTELNATLEAIESRLKAEQFRQRVMLCFRNWEDNAVYPTDLLIQCQNIFLGLLKPTAEEQNDADSFDIDGDPMPAEEDDIDGMPMPEEEDIDGVPFPADSTERGEEDFDGVPMDEAAVEKRGDLENDDRFTTGSWSTVEVEEAPAPANTKTPSSKAEETLGTASKSKWESMELGSRWDRHEGVASAFAAQQQEEESDSPVRKKHRLSRLSPDISAAPRPQIRHVGSSSADQSIVPSIDDEEKRKMLREIEVKVMKLQDEFESEGGVPQAEIDAELNNYRQRLTAKMEEKLAKAGGSAKNEKESREKDRDSRRERDAREERDRDRDRERDSRRSRHHSPPPESGESTSGRRRESLDGGRRREERDRDGRRDDSRDRKRERRADSRERGGRGHDGKRTRSSRSPDTGRRRR